MPAATPPFTPVAQSDEVPSTSCTEDETHNLLREPQARSRSVWKVAVVATVTGLIAAAGTWASAGVATAGEEVAAMATVYAAYDKIGCSNWQQIEITRFVATGGKSECETACEANPECTTFNWQQTACEPGYYKDNGCLLFKDSCSTERNTCWELDYKIEEETTASPDVGSTTA